MNPECPLHKTEMYLLEGIHRESGGFVDNYWYCSTKGCRITVPSRNREEAERQTPLQLKGINEIRRT